MDWTSKCRFCLSVLPGLKEASNDTFNIIHRCLGLELKQIVGCKICLGCSNILEVVCNFKLMCLENEHRMLDALFPVVKNEVEVVFKEEEMSVGHDESDASEPEEENIEPKVEPRIRKPLQRQECPKCNKVFGNIKQHLRCCGLGQINKYVQCEICFASFREENIESHKETHVQVTCDMCGETVSKAAMPVHLVRHKAPNEYTDDDKYRFRKHYCDICNRVFPQLSTHMKVKHTKKEAITCDICGKITTRAHIETHRLLHEENVEFFICDFCGKESRCKYALRTHIENLHLKISRAECKICQKKFHLKHLLQKHIKLQHSELSFLCTVCGKRFAKSDALDNHMEAAHIKSGRYSCGQCEARFNSKSALNYHKNTTHDNAKKKRENSDFSGTCVCGFVFQSNISLRHHIKSVVHKDPDGSYYCVPSCGRTYKRMSALRQHWDVYHKFKLIFKRDKKSFE